MSPEPVDVPAGVDLLDLHAADPARYPFLLESVALPEHRADGFDILFASPGERLILDADFRLTGPGSAEAGGQFLDALDQWWRQERQQPAVPPLLPFTGGWFLFLAYELVRQIEPRVSGGATPAGPVAVAVRVPVALVRNRRSGAAWLVAEPGHEPAAERLRADLSATARFRSPSGDLVSRLSEPDPALFTAAVMKVRELIASGDVYQVNLARRWRATLGPGVGSPAVYARLRGTNPAPFAGIAGFGDWAVISSSPERLVRSRAGTVETRPIAGTRPRADDPLGEEAMRRDLLANPKERAEHIMLIDLERNDLGRVCQPGSVEVDEFMAIESYSHVHHIVSNVRGTLRPDVSPGDVIRALFPGGTITGCPKVRCLEIISSLEAEARGPYTGSMGYLNRDGSCDLNILIRSFVAQGSELSFAAGSGIVADSEPERELAETRAKAKGPLLALAG